MTAASAETESRAQHQQEHFHSGHCPVFVNEDKFNKVKLWLTIKNNRLCQFEQGDVLVISHTVVVLTQNDLLYQEGLR